MIGGEGSPQGLQRQSRQADGVATVKPEMKYRGDGILDPDMRRSRSDDGPAWRAT